jgi:V/A-type H+-transporting ATPase subunit K
MVDFGIPIGAGIAFGLGALGTGIAQSKIGAAGAGTIAEKPETFGLMIILVAIPETLVILGFVVASMIMIMLVLTGKKQRESYGNGITPDCRTGKGEPMAIDDLIKAVEVSGQERISEIMERSKAEAEEIIREAQAKDEPIRKRLLDDAKQSVEIQRNKLLSAAREKSRMEVAKTKSEIFQEVFDEAPRRLASVREHPQYRENLKVLLGEALRDLGNSDVVLHIDKRDEVLWKEILNESKGNYQIVTDLTCAGGLNVYTRDERFVIFNTLESRLKKAKEIYRPEIFSLLFGE